MQSSVSLYIISSNLGERTIHAVLISSSIKHHERREQVLPFLDRRNGLISKSPKWTGVQSYRAVGGGMHIRETREP